MNPDETSRRSPRPGLPRAARLEADRGHCRGPGFVNLVLAFVLLFVYFWPSAPRTRADRRAGREALSGSWGAAARRTGWWRSTATRGPSELSRRIISATAAPVDQRSRVPAAEPAGSPWFAMAARVLIAAKFGPGSHRAQRARPLPYGPGHMGCCPSAKPSPGAPPLLVHHRTDPWLPARLIDPEQRKRLSGVVGSCRYPPDDPQPARDVIDSVPARRRGGHPGDHLTLARDREKDLFRSCRSTAATSSGRSSRRSAAGRCPHVAP